VVELRWWRPPLKLGGVRVGRFRERRRGGGVSMPLHIEGTLGGGRIRARGAEEAVVCGSHGGGRRLEVGEKADK
jgi:hypothetical protein